MKNKLMMKLGFMILATTSIANSAFAVEGPVPKGIPALDHVFLIIMENHSFESLMNNPYTPYIKQYAASANLATNYSAIQHPSLPNYLHIVGGSNFNVNTNLPADWHNSKCTSMDTANSHKVCPISGTETEFFPPMRIKNVDDKSTAPP